MVSAEVREHGHEARVNARADGLVPALTLLARALSPGVPPRGPRGHAVLPKELLDEFAAMEDSRDARSASEDEEPLPGLAVLRPGAGSQEPRPGAGPAPLDWNASLAWLRLGMSERLRDDCIAYLAARQVEGVSLLMQQMVKGALADVLIEHLEIEGVLDDLAEDAATDDTPLGPRLPVDEHTLTRIQAQITRTDRALLRLLGAHGFTSAGPGTAAHASELLADVYCGPRPGTSYETDRTDRTDRTHRTHRTGYTGHTDQAAKGAV
ncbi:hypothetical protein [Streptomyces sp. NPDC018059]|uniref:hypothetical protein n=1 Tax=Streptomyces sp. NPDC018059 TaxID=3365041 RepID=UPI0037B72E76